MLCMQQDRHKNSHFRNLTLKIVLCIFIRLSVAKLVILTAILANDSNDTVIVYFFTITFILKDIIHYVSTLQINFSVLQNVLTK